MIRATAAALLWLAVPAAVARDSTSSDWRTPNPAELLVLDLDRGRLVIELAPAIAPEAVQRVRVLAKRGTYDGLLVHRVIPELIQTGNPNNRDGGHTELPDLAPEFFFELPSTGATTVRSANDVAEGWIGSLPFVSQTRADGSRRGWAAYCPGMAGMGRQAAIDTANSELFVMRTAGRRLDHDYTPIGRVLSGLAVLRGLKEGEVAPEPARIVRARLAADLPAGERPKLQVMDVRGRAFAARVAAARRQKGADLSVCDVAPEVRSAG
ncbi:peptidylprolyl isomerase [Sphingomonas sp. ac-8]|uniref:peptidylprolyl isomerase n=1 Tax=Sphingomonas sp. ac-8 TaxID=3242977 RepID=UPI003A81341F